MKYKNGTEISLGDHVVARATTRVNGIGRINEIDDKCGIVKIWWGGYYLGDIEVGFSTTARPKNIRPAEPEELI